MSTGLETWNQNLNMVNELYPFVGTEMMLAIAGIASWIIWHLIQIKMEISVLDEENAVFQDKQKLAKARKIGAAESTMEAARLHAEGY
jgi:hypothetical protein